MRSTFAGFALVAIAAAKPLPQSSSSCSSDYSGSFNIQVVQPSSKVKRQSSDATTLTVTLSGGKLMDQNGRTGYVAANNQFQFDAPPQAGAKETSGFSVCGDLLAHDNGVTTWDSCKSGSFSNLYSENSASYCKVVNIQVIQASGSSSASTTAVTQITDGQPQAPTSVASPVTQITDGQPQAPTTAAAPVTQISDGQPQAPTTAAAPVTQISDGQPQAPTTAAAPVTQISDGQPQAPTTAAAPVTQISDGQPQAPVATGTGMMPYPGANTTVAGAAPTAVVPATGAASSFTIGSSVVGLIAAVAALAMF